MKLLTSKIKPPKTRVPLQEFADLDRKAKQFEALHDDIEGERWLRGRFSRHFFAFDATVSLPLNHA
jgi:hypothetical protein